MKIAQIKSILNPIIAGIILGLFAFDLGFGISLLNIKSLIITSFFFVTLSILVWITYSKITKVNLKDDAKTFSTFFLLALFPLRYAIIIQSKVTQFKNIPSYLLLMVSLSLFIWFKAANNSKKIKINYKKTTYLIIIIYIIVFSTLSILKHESFNSTAFDLSIFDQEVWSYSKWNIGTNSIIERNLLEIHLQPILFIITPVYWVYSSPIMLLLIQTLAIGLAAIPLYHLTKKVLNEKAAFAIALAYLIHPSTQYMNLFDFHPITLAIPFFILSLYYLEKKKYKTSLVSLAVAALCKEHVALFFITFGVYLFLVHRKRRLGLLSAAIGVIWTYINFKVIIPFFASGGYWHLAGKGPIEIIIEKALNPLVLITQNVPFLILLLLPIGLGIFTLMSPISLLPIFHIAMIFIFLPNGISEIAYQHQANILPFFFVAAVYGIKKANKLLKNKKLPKVKKLMKAVPVLIITTSILSWIVYSPFTILYDLDSFNPNTEHVKNGKEIISKIEPNSSIASTNWMIPHLSQRRNAQLISDLINLKQKTNASTYKNPPKYILIDLSDAILDLKRNANRITQEKINILFNDKNYGIKEVKGTWVLMEYGLPRENNIYKINKFLDKEEYPYLMINLS